MGIKLLRYIDKYLFGFLIYLLYILKFFNKRQKNSKIKKILLIRLWALGSTLLTFPMIKQLKDYYGDNIEYDLLATSRNIGIFKNQGYFNRQLNLFKVKDVLKLLLSLKKYDIVIDAEEYFRISSLISLRVAKKSIGYGNLFNRKIAYTNAISYVPNKHNLMNCISLLNPLGIKSKKPKIMEKLKYTKSNKIKVDNFLINYKNKKTICLHTGGAETSQERFWSKENWIKLIEKLIEKYGNNIIVLLSGTQFEEKQVGDIKKNFIKNNNVINLCGKFNLFEFAYLLEKIDLMISNDTGPMHLSASMGTKTIGLFGPNLPERFGPWPLSKNIGLYKGNGHACIDVYLGKFEKCDNFIDKISVEEVLNKINFN